MSQVRFPGATYRLQFNAGYRFLDGRDLVPYLSDLGITDLYSSPPYRARRGSSHGYDITNPERINSELGTEDDFHEMSARLRHYGMGLLLDIVPNHMAASYENPWWMDVLENGRASAYATFFDIDWNPITAKAPFLQQNRVLLPILGDLYGNVLEGGGFTLRFEDTGMLVRYYETMLPLDPKTYRVLLERCRARRELETILCALEHLPDRDDPDAERILERRREKERVKKQLWSTCQGNPEIKRAVDEVLMEVAADPEELDRLLSAQAYRLAYWKIGYEEINYRRFFDINELAGLRVEIPEVFERRHRRTFGLVHEGHVTGLRIDHIDGLRDPQAYLKRLREATDASVYLVVEKILSREETLPADWPVEGTTGYDFLNALNGIFVRPAGLARLEEIYRERTGNRLPFAETCYQASRAVMKTMFIGDVNALGHRLARLAAWHRQARDVRVSELIDGLVEVTACLPVYRTYVRDFEVSARDREWVEGTVELARRRPSPDEIPGAAFDFIRAVLLVEPPDYLAAQRSGWLDFVLRWQQFSGPVMAKGLEDTAHYRDASLLSQNEVGADPLRERPPCTLDEFHAFNLRRQRQYPGTMNATSTHDTKRGEDARARLNVLTEMPEEWERRLGRWMEWNAPAKVAGNGAAAPSASEEILIYQTLLGAWPARPEEEADFPGRVKEFLQKALREGKQHTSWIAPQEAYENAAAEFVDRILKEDTPFYADFREFQAIVARHGARNALAQLVLKVAAPGVPDFYQGSEFWQFSMVDPDNRRPVDYKRRMAALEQLRKRDAEDRAGLARELGAALTDETKMYATWKALEARKSRPDLFLRGAYIPVTARGSRADCICALARYWEGTWALAVVPRWTCGSDDWGNTELVPPEGAPSEWTEVFTGLPVSGWSVGNLLASFPVALLTR